ncbi:PG0541 family transporter-associated protein [Porphyromonas gingivicanis]|uniref:PG0541 family transporter-associated protein n=1 Tax=Porphyromonas gingivicanis TaxID=266762 RepID=UPI000A680D40|nr:PG0541 family transporter-associated protein [Porphyromonas gingivicanis]
MGTHAWPTLNGALLVACSEERAHKLLDALAEIDRENPLQGLRAFLWSVERSI